MKNRLFCYGTLQLPEVMKAVIGQTYRGVSARLPGYAIYRVKHAEYPGVIEAPNNETSGVLYRGVSDEDLKVLDLFEGELYERRLLGVKAKDGKSYHAWVYVISIENKTYLTKETWHLKTFMKKGFDTFMKYYVNDRKEIYAKKMDK
jgi:gamma-glutamylcyclotransferase (GGCT)/AIG2-like uncharacterized protein YtfP